MAFPPLAVWLWVGLTLAGAGVARAELPVQPGGARLDGLAAVISQPGDTQPGALILRSDVELRARIKLSGEAGQAVLGPLPEGLLGATLDELIGEVLIEREARRLGLSAPSVRRVREQRQALAGLAGGEERLLQLAAGLGLGHREVGQIAERRAVAQGFLEANLVGTTEVTTADLERVYEAGEHPFTDKPLSEVGDMLRQWVGLRRTQCAVKRWVEGLRERAEVRLLVSYAREPGQTPEEERCSVTGAPVTPAGRQRGEP